MSESDKSGPGPLEDFLVPQPVIPSPFVTFASFRDLKPACSGVRARLTNSETGVLAVTGLSLTRCSTTARVSAASQTVLTRAAVRHVRPGRSGVPRVVYREEVYTGRVVPRQGSVHQEQDFPYTPGAGLP